MEKASENVVVTISVAYGERWFVATARSQGLDERLPIFSSFLNDA
jgi:hypothetical protein